MRKVVEAEHNVEISAQRHLAKMYQEGDGLEQDLAQAQHWQDMACANSELYEGQFQLGLNHFKTKNT